MDTNLAYKDWQDLCREELIGGDAVLMAPASTNHTFISGNIFGIFWSYLRGKKCTPVSDGTLVYLTGKDRFVPDMMVVCDRSKIRSDGVHGAPDLVVEVLSPRTAKNDRTYKKDVYAQCGVREYWIVEPANRSIEQHLLQDGQLILKAVHYHHPERYQVMTEEEKAAVETSFRCSLYDDLDIALDDIFEGLLE